MKSTTLAVLLAAIIVNGVVLSNAFADGRSVQVRFETSEVIAEPSTVTVYFYDSVDATVPWASQFFFADEISLKKNSRQQVIGVSFNVTAIDTSDSNTPVWFDTELDGVKVGGRQQILAGVGGLSVSGEIETAVGIRFPGGLQTAPGISSESDPTVLASVKDGVSWGEVGSIPAGFADNTDDGIITETDPTVLASVKDGVSWSEVGSIPAGFADNTDDGILTETDPTVAASVKDGVSWDEVGSIPAGFADNTDDGIIIEADPTVLASVKDGVSWGEVGSIPAGFADNTDDGILTETDPTVLASVKDGVSWGEIGSLPAGFADNTDDGIITETDPLLPAHTANGSAHHAPYTDPNAVAAILAADGPGSGLNADLLDGQNSSAFAITAHNHTGAYVRLTGDDMTGKLITTINSNGEAAIKGANRNGPTNGYLAAIGTLIDFDGVTTADWDGFEMGAVGISTGTSDNDNYGVMGHSNGVGVRGEYSGSPAANYAELGKNGIGIEAAGTNQAGKFIGDINVYDGVNLAMSMGVIKADFELMDSGTGLLQTRIVGTEGTGGQIYLYNEAGSQTIKLDGDSGGDGRITTDEIRITGGSDLSEQFDIDSFTAKVEPGMLVSIDPLNPGKLIRSTEAYDRKVAGIVSGAGGIKPGMMMGQADSIANGEYPVALTGRVYAMVDASEHGVQPGDLLTTSATPGYAMKVTDYQRATGAVIGKAMTPLKGKKGLVLVLVNLQ